MQKQIDNFNFLISTYPQSRLITRAYYAIADCYYNKGDYEEAIAGYKNIVEQFPVVIWTPGKHALYNML